MDDQKKERRRRKDGETCIMRDTGSGGKTDSLDACIQAHMGSPTRAHTRVRVWV